MGTHCVWRRLWQTAPAELISVDASSQPWFKLAWNDKVFAGYTDSAAMNGDKHCLSCTAGS